MNRQTRPDSDPAVDTPLDDRRLPEIDPELVDDAAAVDADWPEREGLGRGAPPPDDGDNDASSYGLPVDGDQVQDEGVAESLGKAITAPVLDAGATEDGGKSERG